MAVRCQAQKEQVGQAIAAAALATVVGFGNVQPAAADVAGLTPCSESKAYAKLEKKELKSLTKRLKNVRRAAARAARCDLQRQRSGDLGLRAGFEGEPPGLTLWRWQK